MKKYNFLILCLFISIIISACSNDDKIAETNSIPALVIQTDKEEYVHSYIGED